MTAITYEVKVKVRQPQQRYKLRLFHISATNPKGAIKRAKKYGEPLEVRKMTVSASSGDIENLEIDKFNPALPIGSAISLDEMIWRKNKNNGEKRRNNLHKDKLA